MNDSQSKRFREYWGDYIPNKRETSLWLKQDKVNLKRENMYNLNFTGVITRIGETQQVSEKFSKREFVLTTNDQYPQEVQFEFHKDQCSMLDTFSIGEEITVGFNLRGRKWTNPQGEDKWFNTLQAWSIVKLDLPV